MQLQEGSKEVIEGCPTRLINVSPHLSHKKWPNSINMVQVVLALMLEFFKLSLSYFFLSKLSFTFSQVGWTNSLQLAVKWLVNSLSPVHFAKLQLNKRKTSSNMLSLGLITRFSFEGKRCQNIVHFLQYNRNVISGPLINFGVVQDAPESASNIHSIVLSFS